MTYTQQRMFYDLNIKRFYKIKEKRRNCGFKQTAVKKND